jgi:hypothetical protein
LSNNFLEVGYNFLDLAAATRDGFEPQVGKTLAGDTEEKIKSITFVLTIKRVSVTFYLLGWGEGSASTTDD